MNPGHQPAPPGPRPTRRLVLGAGAWTAPVIIAAAAAPAYAASMPITIVTNVAPTSDAGGQLPVHVNYNNAGRRASGPVTSMVTMTPAVPGTIGPGAPAGINSGWVLTGNEVAGTGRTYTFLRASGIPASVVPNDVATVSLNFNVQVTEPSAGSTSVVSTVPAPDAVSPSSGVWT